MRKFTDSDIFQKMDANGTITNKIADVLRNVDDKVIINGKIASSLESMHRAYRETLTLKVIKAVESKQILIVSMPIDKRLPYFMPYVKVKRNNMDCVIVDMSKYVTTTRNKQTGAVEEIEKVDITKLYNLLVPAFIALNVLNTETVVSTETTKNLAFLWAKLFNRILMTQRVFVNNPERHTAFMYFAMKFFMIYYMNTTPAIVDNIMREYLNGPKNKYIQMVEANLQQKQIDLYQDWTTFAFNMFSNEMTNIHSTTNVDMNVENYLRLYSNYMGRDGAFLALWSADYFFYCLFVTMNHCYILNDRAWESIVNEDKKIMPKIIQGIMKEL